jgi:hypothetical protein
MVDEWRNPCHQPDWSEMRAKRFITSACGVVAVVAATVALPASPASASGGCSGHPILINAGAGGEPPSVVYGHDHQTGHHYIRTRISVGTGTIVVWYADNDNWNGQWGADRKDTHYTDTFCS